MQGKVHRVWDIKHSKLTVSKPVEQPLESDARNRKDVVFLKQVRNVGAPGAAWSSCTVLCAQT